VTTTEPERATSVPELAGLRARATSRDEELRLFADEDAEYTLRGERDLVLVLERGTLLVEYLPETSRSLEVRSGGRTIDVVGTVFFVSSEPENHPVGVLAGAVEVREEDASSPKRIEAGESLTGDGESAQFRPDEMDEAIASIDLEEHHRRLERSARRRARRDAEEAATRRPKPSADEPPTLEQKRARAERDALAALSRREYGAAARHYERLLSMVDAGATRASTTRLELAQIYAMHLGRRARAIDHLRAFLDHHPEDVAAPSARARLCELLGPSAHAEPRCGEASVRGD
jgi:tetratricopeptide (TPR) repeat protein